MTANRALLISAAITLAGVIACGGEKSASETTPAPAPTPAPAVEVAPLAATANIQGAEGSGITGMVEITEIADGVQVVAHIEGAAPGPHGFHLHEYGDCSAEDYSSAGGHFNPTDVPHGGPADQVRHAGDFGNIEVGEEGSGHAELASAMLTVAEGPNSVVGKAIIFHEKSDDLVSQPTGAAGGRIACGVVELKRE